jgi:hypothetical protein
LKNKFLIFFPFGTKKGQVQKVQMVINNQNPEAQVWATPELTGTHRFVLAQRCGIQIQMCAPARTVRPEAEKRRMARV